MWAAGIRRHCCALCGPPLRSPPSALRGPPPLRGPAAVWLAAIAALCASLPRCAARCYAAPARRCVARRRCAGPPPCGAPLRCSWRVKMSSSGVCPITSDEAGRRPNIHSGLWTKMPEKDLAKLLVLILIRQGQGGGPRARSVQVIRRTR